MNDVNQDFANQIAGGLWGLLIGDAVGVPYEGRHQGDLPLRDDLEMIPPDGFRKSYPTVPSGTWSDDGAQALALLASLLDCGRMDADDFGERLVDWLCDGYMAVNNRVFDCGTQTGVAIDAMIAGVPAASAGPALEATNGNGSLMRVLPLALWHRGSDEDLVRDAHLQSQVTHGHLRSQVCCALHCLWARRILEADAKPWNSAVTRLRGIYGESSPAWAEIATHIRPDEPPVGRGSGYVVDCFQSARMALESNARYEDVIKASVAIGHDTDTTACVAGGIAGLREGVAGIPDRWMRGLRGKPLVEPLLQQLLLR